MYADPPVVESSSTATPAWLVYVYMPFLHLSIYGVLVQTETPIVFHLPPPSENCQLIGQQVYFLQHFRQQNFALRT